jgi:hypothetical protein
MSDKSIQIILSQTTYNEVVAIEKLKQFDNDHIKVIRDFMGLPDKKEDKVRSVNQEIYKQIRKSLDASMSEFREKNQL